MQYLWTCDTNRAWCQEPEVVAGAAVETGLQAPRTGVTYLDGYANQVAIKGIQ